MSEGTRAELRRALLGRIAEAVEEEFDAAAVSDDASLRDDLGLGSVDAVMLVLDLEEHYGIEVADDELAGLDTVGSLLALVEAKRPAGEPGAA